MIRILTAALPVLLLACSREPATAPAAPPPAPTAAASLDALDPRAPVPLLPMMAHHQKQNMRDHLAAVQEIIAALALDDYAAAERAATRIASSPAMEQTCSHMGAGAPGFTEQSLGFHRTADRIVSAARDRDRTRVLTELGATLQTCTACHDTWKQHVVDEPTWRATTGAAPPHASH
jgi:hypothetical protein